MDDEYLSARLACMQIFYQTYHHLPIADLRQKYYGAEVALQNKRARWLRR